MRPLLYALLLVIATAHAGQRVTLQATDASGHWFSLAAQRGRTVVVTFASRKTEKEARQVNQALTRHTGSNLLLVNIVDLRDVPNFAHAFALQKIRESDRPGRVNHLVDKDGKIARGFGVDSRHHVDIFIVDGQGRLIAHYTGQQQLPQAEARLAGLERPVPRAARRAPRP